MAWNGSNNVGAASCRTNRARQDASPTKRSARRVILAGLIVIALGGCALYFYLRPAYKLPATNKPKNYPSQIAEVAPAIVTNAAKETVPKKLPLAMKRDHSELTREELLTKVPPWAYTVEDRKRLDPGYAKKHERFLKRQEKKIWKTYVDTALAALLFNNGRMGAMPPFNPRFKDMFLKSLETPIVPSHVDSPEVLEKKRQMNETKIWLKEQMDDGKDIVAILNDEYNRQRKITSMHDQLRRELFQLQKKATSVQEIDDYIAAANRMLEEAGSSQKIIFPTKMTKLRLDREAANKKQEN